MNQDAEYSQMVRRLTKPGEEIVATLSANGAHLLHMAMGISGEAGEMLDAIKKAVIYRKELDVNNVIEELGDLEFYMEGLRSYLRVTREQVLAHNMAKLSARYASARYSDQQAQERADKS